ncbi:MAG: recombination regulator RecX [Gammaproteobacteria bacterium]|nr:recombination regulator RecX [Gammaproteobacteria bacterium]
MPEGFDVAMRLLTRREHSAHQLRNKLKMRDFTEDAIDEVLEACMRLDLQSDVRFAEMFCCSRVNRGYGPVVIRQSLRQEGVSTDIIDDVLEEAEADIDWMEAVARAWQKKFRGTVNVTQLEKQKQRKFLKYRGFSEATIRAFFETLEVDNQIV